MGPTVFQSLWVDWVKVALHQLNGIDSAKLRRDMVVIALYNLVRKRQYKGNHQGEGAVASWWWLWWRKGFRT